MARVALRIAYDGTAFSGSQRQPDVRTVEGDLLAALHRIGAVTDPAAERFLVASRTDKGVSAAGNVAAFDTSFARADLVRALNAHLHDAWALAVAPVDDGFHPRSSPLRRYRYLQARDAVPDAATFAAALARFGGEHDYTAFARIEPGVEPRRTLAPPRVEDAGPYLACDFEAPSFLWNQIRRMIAAALAVARGDATLADIERALAHPRGARDLGLAPPEPLVLLEVRHDLPWETDERGLERVRAELGARMARAELARAIAGSLRDSAR